MTRRSHGHRCVICRKAVDLSDKTLIRRDLPAGLNMNRIHRIEANYWHAPCWAEATAMVAESREKAAAQRRDDLRAYCNEMGLEYPESAREPTSSPASPG